MLAVSDNYVAGDTNFPYDSDRVLTHLPGGYSATKVYLGYTGYTDKAVVKAAIISNVTAGALVVNYYGHGGYNLWASEQILLATDVASLNNPTMLPVFLQMTCDTGRV